MMHLPAVHAVVRPSSAGVAIVTGVAIVATVTHVVTGLAGVAHVDVLGSTALLIPIASRRGRARGPGLTGNGNVGVLLRQQGVVSLPALVSSNSP